MSNATISVYLDKRRLRKKDNLYPIQIRVHHLGKRKYYATGYKTDEITFAKMFMGEKGNLSSTNKIVKTTILKNSLEGDGIIKELGNKFTFSLFDELFIYSKKKRYTVFEAFAKYQEEKISVSTKEGYKAASNSFKLFLKETGRNKTLHFQDVTADWMQEYEDWMISEGKSLSTVGIYAKYMQRLFSKFNKIKGIQPFGKDEYIIPSTLNIKKALKVEQINYIYHFPCDSGSNMEYCRDIWVYSYLANGCNMKDIAGLKWKNYENGKITFYRQKTRNSKKRKLAPIEILLTKEANAILMKYCTDNTDDEAYILPIYTKDMTPKQKHDKVRQELKNVRKWINRIWQKLGYEGKIDFQAARHSWASVSRNAGVDKSYISQALGHSSQRVTDLYLDSFEEQKIKENQSHLLDTTRTYLKVV